MPKSGAVQTDKAPKAIGPYSQGRWAEGPFFFSAGQAGLAPDTGKLISDDVAEQAGQVMRNLGGVLEAAGLSFNNVIKTNIYLADMADFAAVNEVYASFFEGAEVLPARTTIQAAGLPMGAKVEIEMIAC
jgi:2-iminobutanoate/2-iminopropanoate deaminase